jgi:hypothetical protein
VTGADVVVCEYCGDEYKKQGLAAHQRFCDAKPVEGDEDPDGENGGIGEDERPVEAEEGDVPSDARCRGIRTHRVTTSIRSNWLPSIATTGRVSTVVQRTASSSTLSTRMDGSASPIYSRSVMAVSPSSRISIP